jgi:hypothetical protein
MYLNENYKLENKMNYRVCITRKLNADLSVKAKTEAEAKTKAEALIKDPNYKGWEFYDSDDRYEAQPE